MIPVFFKVTYSGPVPRHMARKLKSILKSCWEDLGVYWHHEMRPKHFTVAGGKEYSYAKRTRDYMIRKARVQGHQDPLVWTGMSRFRSGVRDVRAKKDGVKIVMNVPGLNRKRSENSPDMQEELRTVSRDEARILARRMQDIARSWLADINETTTVTINPLGEGASTGPGFLESLYSEAA